MSTITNRIGPADNGRTLTMEEFLEAEFEEGFRYELGRGVIEMVQVPSDPHGQVVTNLSRATALYDEAHPEVVLRYGGGNEFRVWIPEMISERHPDFAVVLERTPANAKGRRAPSLVVEVVSPRSRDRDYRIKREEYLTFGILEYWIIDHVARRMTLLVREGADWVERTVEEDRPIPSLVLPGLEAILTDLWRKLDRYRVDVAEDDARD